MRPARRHTFTLYHLVSVHKKFKTLVHDDEVTCQADNVDSFPGFRRNHPGKKIVLVFPQVKYEFLSIANQVS